MLLDLEKTIKGCGIRKVLHVGGHLAEERRVYDKIGVPVKWIEANEELCRKIARRVKFTDSVVHAVITDDYRESPWFTTTRTASDSVLEPHINLKNRRDLKTVSRTKVSTYPLRHFQEDENFLNLDIQGAELLALRGANLDPVEYIFTEVHEVETYKGCPRVSDIDEFLSGFRRANTGMTKYGWGEAFYVRK